MKKTLISLVVTLAMAVSGFAVGNRDKSTTAGKYPTIKLMIICGSVPSEAAEVAAALSVITREKAGCNVEFIPIQVGNWAAQLNLLLSGGDDTLDVFMGGYTVPYTTVVANGQALELDSLMAPYANEMKRALGQNVYEAGRINGKLYGIGRLLDQASTPVYNLRADVAREFGYSNGNKIDLAELTELFRKIKAKYPDKPLIGPMNGGLNLGDGRFDALGNPSLMGVLGNFGQDTKVINYYESKEYAELVGYFKQWKALGCYMPDILNTTDAPVDYIPSGKGLGCFAGHFSAEMNGIWASNNFGVEMVSLQIYQDAVAVSPGLYYCINPATKSVEAAAKLIYLMTTDPAVVNILVNGIGGKHYRLDNAGIAHYPPGQNVSTTGWSMGYGWAALNSTISHPFEYPADYYKQMLTANATAHQSKAFGCQFDMTSVIDAISACTNVINQYKPAIETGTADNIDATVAAFKQALKNAGIDEIVAVKQRQLDAFLASK
jgi:putative aldouronate transport system substrate-binding protein